MKTDWRVSIVVFLFLVLHGYPSYGAVVLQYHHVDDNTPESTSVSKAELSSHIQWLIKNEFKIISSVKLIEMLEKKTIDPFARIAVITFDDSGVSVCDNAWPLLKKHQLPFTVFVSTDMTETGSSTQCSWKELRKMVSSGLVVVGNHGAAHAHMAEKTGFENFQTWKNAMEKDINHAQSLIDKHLGKQPRIFAYPYGEADKDLGLLVKDMGYTAFGQQSGAIGNQSSAVLLPRYPLSGQYAEMETFATKMLSLPFAYKHIKTSPPSTSLEMHVNPPELEMEFDNKPPEKIRCYLGNGIEIPVRFFANKVLVKSDDVLSEGRHRYNCTAPSSVAGRFYWFSYQWIL